jgi:hypothetical protein
MTQLAQMLEMIGLPAEGLEAAADDASFRIDDQIDLTIALTADGQLLRLRALIGHARDPAQAALTQRIATANYAGALTGGGALGLNPVNGEMLLFKEIPVALCEPVGLQSLVSRLVDAAIQLKTDLAELASTSTAQVAAAAPEPSVAFGRPTHWLRG